MHQVRGGGSVVMERSTAGWCDICAEHEEWIPDMVDSNGDRIIRVNLHSAINDPLGNEASNYRKGWLGQTEAFHSNHRLFLLKPLSMIHYKSIQHQ